MEADVMVKFQSGVSLIRENRTETATYAFEPMKKAGEQHPRYPPSLEIRMHCDPIEPGPATELPVHWTGEAYDPGSMVNCDKHWQWGFKCVVVIDRLAPDFTMQRIEEFVKTTMLFPVIEADFHTLFIELGLAFPDPVRML